MPRPLDNAKVPRHTVLMTNTETTETIHSYTADGKVITAEMRAAAAVVPAPTLEERRAAALAAILRGERM
jgi:hypothetical protein